MAPCFSALFPCHSLQPAGMRARQRGNFLLRAQKKVTKEKGTLPCSVGPGRANFPAGWRREGGQRTRPAGSDSFARPLRGNPRLAALLGGTEGDPQACSTSRPRAGRPAEAGALLHSPFGLRYRSPALAVAIRGGCA